MRLKYRKEGKGENTVQKLETMQRVRNVLTKKVSAADAISELNKKYRVSKKQVEGSRV